MTDPIKTWQLEATKTYKPWWSLGLLQRTKTIIFTRTCTKREAEISIETVQTERGMAGWTLTLQEEPETILLRVNKHG